MLVWVSSLTCRYVVTEMEGRAKRLEGQSDSRVSETEHVASFTKCLTAKQAIG